MRSPPARLTNVYGLDTTHAKASLSSPTDHIEFAPFQRVDGVPRYAIPVEVAGPTNFLLVAVWSKGSQASPYVEGVVRAVKLYRKLFAQYPTVLAGDLNSNAIWDSNHAAGLSHSALVKMLSELGLVSSYHFFHSEAHGEEKQPTYYFQWKEQRTFHIDYCFIPKAWAPKVQRVEVGSYMERKGHSDHRPLLVEIADHGRSVNAMLNNARRL